MKILVVVDMQNDFIDGALGSAEAKKIVPNVIEKIKTYDSKCVFATKDTHYPDNYLKTQEGKNLPIPHCLILTPGWRIHKDIAPLIPSRHIALKETFGCNYLPDYIAKTVSNENDSTDLIDEIELIGLCTDICVISNAMVLKAAFPEVKITVDSSCCAGVTPESHETALNAMKACQINII